MTGSSLGNQTDELHDLASDLYRQGERCAQAGFLIQAASLMEQAWSIAGTTHAAIASGAAWEAGWLYARTGNYRKAAEWFSRVHDPVTPNAAMWAASRQALVELCLAGSESTAQVSTGVQPPSSTSTTASSFSESLPDLKVTNLGRFQISRGGDPLPKPKSRKPVALFRYLLTRHRRTAPKEELMELLWPDARPREAAHSLHTAVSYLRNHIDPPSGSYLLFDSGSYMLNPNASITDDSTAFQQAIDTADDYRRAGDHERARRHYVEGLYHYAGDYVVDDSDAVWAIAERERLLTRYLTALDHLGRLFAEQGELELAVDTYQRLLTRDSYREDVHERIMRCYLSLGRRGAALQQYETCAAILERDLGLEPAQELRQLHQSITEPRLAEPAKASQSRNS